MTSSYDDAGKDGSSSSEEEMKDPLAPGDVLSANLEREWFGTMPEEQQSAERDVEALARQALSIAIMLKSVGPRQRGTEAGNAHAMIDFFAGRCTSPWELALQRWLESAVLSGLTFHRHSRRDPEPGPISCCLDGSREGWMLHVILDTSGSMTHDIPCVLGAIADFCVRLLR